MQEDREKAIRRITEKKCADENRQLSTANKELAKHKKRLSEIDTRIKRVYEDHISGKLSDELFRTFAQDYEAEKASLRESISTHEATVRNLEANRMDVSQFISLLQEYAGITELTRPALMALTDRSLMYPPSRGRRLESRI